MSEFKLSKGKKSSPDFITLYGVDGIGKTSFAASAPNPVVIDIEQGSHQINTSRIDEGLTTFSDVVNAVKFAASQSFETIIIDSLDRLETITEVQVCTEHKKDSIEDFGYGAGHKHVQDKWEKELMPVLKQIRKTKNVVLIAHDIVKTFADPTMLDNYDRHEIKLNKKLAALVREEVDGVYFANYRVLVKKENKSQTKGKALGGDVRILYTERRPGHEGKNRFGLPYEIELPDNPSLGWDHYQEIKKSSDAADPTTLIRQIEGLIPEIKDEMIREKVQAEVAKTRDPSALNAYLKRINVIIGAEKGE